MGVRERDYRDEDRDCNWESLWNGDHTINYHQDDDMTYCKALHLLLRLHLHHRVYIYHYYINTWTWAWNKRSTSGTFPPPTKRAIERSISYGRGVIHFTTSTAIKTIVHR